MVSQAENTVQLLNSSPVVPLPVVTTARGAILAANFITCSTTHCTVSNKTSKDKPHLYVLGAAWEETVQHCTRHVAALPSSSIKASNSNHSVQLARPFQVRATDLRFPSPRVSHQQHVHFTTNMCT